MNKVWQTTYAHDRRKHRHRCLVCSRILETGDQVTMFRVPQTGKTRAFHASHNEERHSPTYSWLEVAEVWANER